MYFEFRKEWRKLVIGNTRERIRQIEAKALRQLRAPERARRLRALMAAR